MIGKLLHVANSCPPCRKRFYVMKEKILDRYGTPDGFDVQHFEGKKCFGCGGTGVWESWYTDDQDYCHKCGGSGWWRQEKWVTLKRYKIDGYTFHCPDGVSYETPDPMPATNLIEGFINHELHEGFADVDSSLWLGLMFDLEYFCEVMNEGSVWCRWPRTWRPLIHIKQGYSLARRWILLYKSRCIDCGKHLWSLGRRRCEPCINAQPEDIPF